jgi:hypothetical protein
MTGICAELDTNKAVLCMLVTAVAVAVCARFTMQLQTVAFHAAHRIRAGLLLLRVCRCEGQA